MALTKFEKDMRIIANLDDEPNDVGGLTAGELKEKFDEGGEAVKAYLNDTLLPEAQTQFAAREELQGLVLGQIPDGTITEPKLAETLQEKLNAAAPASEVFSKAESLKPETAAGYGLGAEAVPDDVLSSLSFMEASKRLGLGLGWRVSDSGQGAKALAFGGGKFVALGSKTSNSAWSTDGISWTKFQAGLDSFEPGYMTYGGGRFVAVNSNGSAAAWSDDGLTWNLSTLPRSTAWSCIAYGAGVFVATTGTGSMNYAAWSEDGGETWTECAMPGNTASAWTGIAYGKDKFVAVRGANGWQGWSADGKTWTGINHLSAGSSGTMGKRILYDGEKFVSVYGGSSTNSVYSYDGLTWATGTAVKPLSGALVLDMAYGDGMYIGLIQGTTCECLYSTDGIHWSRTHYPPTSQTSHSAVAYGNGVFAATTSLGSQSLYAYPRKGVLDNAFTALCNRLALLENTDVLVDGPFLLAEKSYEAQFRGSRNQRLIDLNATRKSGRLTLWQQEDGLSHFTRPES